MDVRLRLLVVGLAMFAATLRVSGVSFSQRSEDPIRVEVEAVNLLVSVIDRKSGRFVKDLTVDDFLIYEDGVLQRITNFSRETDLPLTIALCIDTSSSVRLKLEFEKQAAMDFIYTVMRPRDRTLLAEFDTGVTLLHDFTSNPNDLAEEIKRLRAGGGTSLYDAIYLISEQKLLYETGRRTMVILSDGGDLTSTHTLEEALRMAHMADVAIYAISTTRFGASIDYSGENALRQITESTGGRVFFPHSIAQLDTAFREVDEELRSQYNLTYVPTNREHDGSFRNIEVRVTRRDTDTRHRKGYYIPSAPPVR
jgi:Ca-activated chloride channel homolog